MYSLSVCFFLRPIDTKTVLLLNETPAPSKPFRNRRGYSAQKGFDMRETEGNGVVLCHLYLPISFFLSRNTVQSKGVLSSHGWNGADENQTISLSLLFIFLGKTHRTE